MPRFYLRATLKANIELTFPEALSHHIHVLRLDAHDTIILFDGQGQQISARIIEPHKKHTRVLLLDDLTQSPTPKVKLHLGQALCRSDRMDLIIQKAVELNVAEITPLQSEYGQGRLTGAQLEKKIQHWQEVIISACEQSGQNHLPRLNPLMPFNTWVQNVDAELKLNFAIKDSVSLRSCRDDVQSCALVVGPEGDLSVQELKLCDQMNFKRISLGSLILRVETASIVALGLCNYHFHMM